jgi:hypothetical protein
MKLLDTAQADVVAKLADYVRSNGWQEKEQLYGIGRSC